MTAVDRFVASVREAEAVLRDAATPARDIATDAPSIPLATALLALRRVWRRARRRAR